MFNQISYNVIIERFKVFATGHYLIRRFSHGQIDVTDLEKEQEFPWMHVVPVSLRADPGARVFSFDVIFADIPRDKEANTDYQKENISDCIRLAEDLLAEIANGLVVFGPEVELETGSTITPFIQEYTHTLSGATLALTISVPNNYDACAIPADWSIGGSGSGQPPSPPVSLVLKVNNVDNVNQNVLDLVNGTNVTIEDLGDGRVRINSSGGGGGSVAWGAITGTLSNQTDLQTALNLKADISSLGAVAFSNDYNDLDNLPTIPTAQGLQDVITLDPVLTTDNTIDCGTNALTVDNTVNFIVNSTSKLSINVNGTAELSIDSQSVGMVESSGAVQSTVVVDTVKAGMQSTSGADSTSLIIAPASVKLVTPSVNDATAVVGQILTLTNAGSGEVEFTTLAGLPPTGAAGGDLQGTYPNPTVHRVHGIDFQSGTPSTGDVWLYEGSPAKWQHQQLPAVHVGNDSAVTGSTVKDALNHLNTTKVEANAVITAGTATKVTYDAKGLITSGTTLAASDLPTGIDAAKIGAGTVLNTEFGYLDGVTSPIQIQIDGKQSTLISGTNIKTLNSQTLLGSGNLSVGTVTSVSGTGTTAGLTLSGSVTGSGNLTLGGTLSTPANTISDSTTAGRNLLTLPNPSAIAYLRINADNTVSALTLAQIKTDLSISSAIMTAAYTNVGTGFESLTELSFAVSANKTYKWRATLTYTATAGITFSLTGPASPTFNNYRFTASNAATTNTVFNAAAYDTGTNAAASGNGLCTADGIIRPTANGTVTVRIRCATAGLMTVRAGSIIEFEEVL